MASGKDSICFHMWSAVVYNVDVGIRTVSGANSSGTASGVGVGVQTPSSSTVDMLEQMMKVCPIVIIQFD